MVVMKRIPHYSPPKGKGVRFKSFSAARFRGFQNCKIDGLDQFNLILGRNNVGKTALLEALFLMLGPTNPQLPLTVTAFRGIDQFRTDPEDLWGWLFYEKDLKQKMTFEAETSQGVRSLNISLGPQREIRSNRNIALSQKKRPSVATATTAMGPGELLLVYEDEKRQRVRSRAFIRENGIGIGVELGKSVAFPISTFVTSRNGYVGENAERFSKLEEVGRESELIQPLRALEPRLSRLAVIVTGAGPMIHGDIGIGRMIPIPMMGEGIGRLMTILLAIASSKDGIVIVDEIDTGIHYSALVGLWTSIAEAARERNVQLFASTHSWECMKAAHEAFSKARTYDLSIQRLDRKDSGEVFATNYDHEMVEVALSSGVEVR